MSPAATHTMPRVPRPCLGTRRCRMRRAVPKPIGHDESTCKIRPRTPMRAPGRARAPSAPRRPRGPENSIACTTVPGWRQKLLWPLYYRPGFLMNSHTPTDTDTDTDRHRHRHRHSQFEVHRRIYDRVTIDTQTDTDRQTHTHQRLHNETFGNDTDTDRHRQTQTDTDTDRHRHTPAYS